MPTRTLFCVVFREIYFLVQYTVQNSSTANSGDPGRFPYLPDGVCMISAANWRIFGQLGGFFVMHVKRPKQLQYKL